MGKRVKKKWEDPKIEELKIKESTSGSSPVIMDNWTCDKVYGTPGGYEHWCTASRS